MKKETLVSLELPESELEALTALAVKANKTTEVYLKELIAEKIDGTLLNKEQLAVATMELAWQKVDKIEDYPELRQAIAGDLLKLRIALMQKQKGQVDPEKIKEWAIELFT